MKINVYELREALLELNRIDPGLLKSIIGDVVKQNLAIGTVNYSEHYTGKVNSLRWGWETFSRAGLL